MIAGVLACAALVRADLKADQIALIVNKNVPDSAKLADYYAKARLLPDGRIIERIFRRAMRSGSTASHCDDFPTLLPCPNRRRPIE